MPGRVAAAAIQSLTAGRKSNAPENAMISGATATMTDGPSAAQ